MSFRSVQIYIQPKTQKRLRLIAKLFPSKAEQPHGLGEATTDEIADALINEAILRQYPELLQLEAELRKVEEAFAQRVRGEKAA